LRLSNRIRLTSATESFPGADRIMSLIRWLRYP